MLDNKVRDAAAILHAAILEAEAGGLHVDWPRRFADLPAIAVSATKKATAPAAEPVRKAKATAAADK